MRIVILIPTYNEAPNIALLIKDVYRNIKKIKKHLFLLLIVDDKSPDGTGKIVSDLMKANKSLFLLSGKKAGLGKAMIRGYLYAINKLKADVVISNEADFAFDFKHLPDMIEKIEESVDVVVGSRHVGVGKTEGWTLTRRVNHWIANTFFGRWVAGVRVVYDKNGAFRAVRVKGVMDQINWKKLRVRGFAFFFYTIALYSEITDKFYEIPAIYTFRKKGESKVSFNRKYIKSYLTDCLEYAKLAFRIRLKKYRINI
ncbi:MAG: Glycosyltransferase [Candidatus Woesebacteria bacterium GW2011_GWB1_43_14]|uniref:Glycosyltransferase n=1 Tax=Candidatus Woesebacteria bacterium GW2011_GWB1_43_14 TaxID=1618578 RepID=A0A0G1DHW0_9BACT|nr:MAG: Glycosyltransferase [Candidatus Woesebacteria bacterium GW2011_GWA1_39_11b]KKS78303.1 MAG: Glycosyltransferase [Candidatus Woesebacteria bacterium GW2011_GWC1_42_9]KKS97279.1 MAG: Glycosyltransferase [Candidatus Woesebacteria bacterium GW2011_GWB1_43_14]